MSFQTADSLVEPDIAVGQFEPDEPNSPSQPLILTSPSLLYPPVLSSTPPPPPPDTDGRVKRGSSCLADRRSLFELPSSSCTSSSLCSALSPLHFLGCNCLSLSKVRLMSMLLVFLDPTMDFRMEVES